MPEASNAALAAVGGLALLAIALGLFLPDRTVGGDMPGMPSTHYMGLLAASQPWNLLLFMALPVVLAETLAITEIALLFGPKPAWVRTLNRVAGLLAGPVMLGILLHLIRYAVAPLTVNGGWRGPADVIAVLAYLAGAVPMMGITLVELGLLGDDERSRWRLHAVFVAAFLVVAHIAMIFGMLDPSVMGWQDPASTHLMPDGTQMPGMHH
ncbi:DUF6803 family protein [Actinomycetota bacterium]